MSLPPLFVAGIIAVPSSGRKPLTVQFSDNSNRYGRIVESSSAADRIVEDSTNADRIVERDY